MDDYFRWERIVLKRALADIRHFFKEHVRLNVLGLVVSFVVAWIRGQDGPMNGLVAGFATLGVLFLVVVVWTVAVSPFRLYRETGRLRDWPFDVYPVIRGNKVFLHISSQGTADSCKVTLRHVSGWGGDDPLPMSLPWVDGGGRGLREVMPQEPAVVELCEFGFRPPGKRPLLFRVRYAIKDSDWDPWWIFRGQHDDFPNDFAGDIDVHLSVYAKTYGTRIVTVTLRPLWRGGEPDDPIADLDIHVEPPPPGATTWHHERRRYGRGDFPGRTVWDDEFSLSAPDTEAESDPPSEERDRET